MEDENFYIEEEYIEFSEMVNPCYQDAEIEEFRLGNVYSTYAIKETLGKGERRYKGRRGTIELIYY